MTDNTVGRIMVCQIFGNQIFGKDRRILVGIWQKNNRFLVGFGPFVSTIFSLKAQI
jgi:hypothetical protein